MYFQNNLNEILLTNIPQEMFEKIDQLEDHMKSAKKKLSEARTGKPAIRYEPVYLLA